MSNTRLQAFRGFLTERFTTVAMDIFGEVETIVETYYEENRRLRNVLQMIISPEIKLSRIDVSRHTGATAEVREQTPQLNTRVHQERSEPLPKQPKVEPIEYDINWDNGNLIKPDCVKSDPEGQHMNTPCITNSFNIQVVDHSPNSSASYLADEGDYEPEDASSVDSDAVTQSLKQCQSKDSTSKSCEPQKDKLSKGKSMTNLCLQKTMLELPRIMTDKPFTPLPDPESILARLTEAFKDLPDDTKPLITKMDLTADVEMVDCAFGNVPKGSPLSYQCPLPSSKDYRTHDNAPPQPPLPLCDHMLEPMSAFPPLMAKEREHINVMQITWEEAHSLEYSTRRHKESVEDLRRLRLTTRFREICNLTPGQSQAAQLIIKLQKGVSKYKSAKIKEERKAEALREYCANLRVNWSPCGLVVHPNAPWLGALPDGLVYDPKENPSYGLVHIKCICFQSFTECALLMCKEGVVQVKRDHSCYWHVQAEMMVTGTSWCDLFVFSGKDLLVQRIYRDSAMINLMKKKLNDFFFCHYLPALVSD